MVRVVYFAVLAGYEAEQSGNFRVPDGYIRFPRRTGGEDDVTACEYCLEVREMSIDRMKAWTGMARAKFFEDRWAPSMTLPPLLLPALDVGRGSSVSNIFFV